MATSNKRPVLSIVVPVYNEAENFPSLYEEIRLKIKTPNKIIVVYDFEADTTVPVVRSFQKTDKNIILVENTLGRGALNALKSGFDFVKDGPILVTMADLSDELDVVDSMYEKYLNGAQLVCGSRYMRGGRQIGGPLFKRILSRIAGVSLFWLRGIPTHDVTNNFKLYDKNMLMNLQIESSGGFEVAMEITVKAFRKGYKITEIPSTWRDRTAGETNFKLWKWLPSYGKWYFYAYGPRAR